MNKCIALLVCLHFISISSFLIGSPGRLLLAVCYGLSFKQYCALKSYDPRLWQAVSIWELVLRPQLLDRDTVQNLGQQRTESKQGGLPFKKGEVLNEMKICTATKYIYSFRNILARHCGRN